MSNVVGTPKRVTLDGLTFDVVADANFNQVKGKYNTEEVVTSGKVIPKRIARAQKTDSVNIQANGGEAEALKSLSERNGNFPMSYETAASDVFRAVGFIHFEGHDTDSGIAVITMFPESADGWAPFLN